MAGWRLAIDPDYRDLMLTLGPMLYWPLNDADGAVDLSGSGYDGSAAFELGTAPTSAVNTDSASTRFPVDPPQSIEAPPSAPVFADGEPRTFTGWTRRMDNGGSIGASTSLLYGAGTTYVDFYLGRNQGAPSLTLWVEETRAVTWSNAWPDPYASPESAPWVHWALVVDGEGNAELYVNGESKGIRAIPNYSSRGWGADPGALRFGALPCDAAHFAVFPHALTARQVRMLYEARKLAAAGRRLDLNDGKSYRAMAPLSVPLPERDAAYAGSVDTEGDPLVSQRYRNREISFALRVYGESADGVQEAVGRLQRKLAKVNREGGELGVGTPAGSFVVFDLVGAVAEDVQFDHDYAGSYRARLELRLEAKPFGRGMEQHLGDFAGTGVAVVGTLEDVPGDVPALGRVEVTSPVRQERVVWGVESARFDPATLAPLTLGADVLQPYAPAVRESDASAATGQRIRSGELPEARPMAFATTGRRKLYGTYRVLARVAAPLMLGVHVGLEWATSDLTRPMRNDFFELPAPQGVWVMADLGLIHADGEVEARVLGRADHPYGATLFLDSLVFVPVDESWGMAEARAAEVAPTTFIARDDFGHSGSEVNLTGRALPTGGTWQRISGSGDSNNDFRVRDGYAYRAALSDANVRTGGRFAIAGSSTVGAVRVEAGVAWVSLPYPSPPEFAMGVVARAVNRNNYIFAGRLKDDVSSGEVVYGVRIVVDGALAIWRNFEVGSSTELTSGWQDVALEVVDDTWRMFLRGEELGWGYHPALGSGGPLASGRVGMYDAWTGSEPGFAERWYRRFAAHVPTTDAVIFPARRLEIAYDGVRREVADGSAVGRPCRVLGDYLLLPPSGGEGRRSRLIVAAMRGPQELDRELDPVLFRVYATPRYLVLPEE